MIGVHGKAKQPASLSASRLEKAILGSLVPFLLLAVVMTIAGGHPPENGDARHNPAGPRRALVNAYFSSQSHQVSPHCQHWGFVSRVVFRVVLGT
jgi:hypothetical protein